MSRTTMRDLTITPDAIHDVDEFLETFDVGDEYWTIKCYLGKPTSVEKETIVGFIPQTAREAELGLFDKYSYSWDRTSPFTGEKLITEGFVGDTVNAAHGAFRTKIEALQAFHFRLWMWENDTDLGVYFLDQLEESRRWDEMMSIYGDKDYSY